MSIRKNGKLKESTQRLRRVGSEKLPEAQKGKFEDMLNKYFGNFESHCKINTISNKKIDSGRKSPIDIKTQIQDMMNTYGLSSRKAKSRPAFDEAATTSKKQKPLICLLSAKKSEVISKPIISPSSRNEGFETKLERADKPKFSLKRHSMAPSSRNMDSALKYRRSQEAITSPKVSLVPDAEESLDLEASLVPIKVTREELQRITETIKKISRKEFELLPTTYVGDLSKLSLVINDKLKLSTQYGPLAI